MKTALVWLVSHHLGCMLGGFASGLFVYWMGYRQGWRHRGTVN